MLLQRTAVTRGAVTYPEPLDKQLVGGDAGVMAFVPSPLEAAYFDKTMELFAAAHVKVLLLTIPVGHATIEAVAPPVRSEFSRFLARSTRSYPNVVASPPGLLGWPDDFYIDGSHMNERGAKAFTARLASCLRQLNPLSDRPPPCDLDWR